MSFMQVRMAMSDVREYDFTGATVLTANPQAGAMSFTAFSATAKEGEDSVVVDWGDGTTEELTPAETTRAVALSHTYRQAGAVRIRIQNALDSFYPSGAGSLSWSAFYCSTSNLHAGARPLTGIVSLGSNITNRTLSPALFANTSITGWPTLYDVPKLVAANSNSYVVPAACFKGCTALASVTGAPSSLRGIDSEAFAGCTALASLSGFSGCTNLCYIGSGAFSGCTSLTTLEGLPAFNGDPWTGLLRGAGTQASSISYPVVLSEELGSYQRVNQVCMRLGANAFNGCSSLASLGSFSLPSSTRLTPGAFANCPLLTSTTGIPDHLWYSAVRSDLADSPYKARTSYAYYIPERYYLPSNIQVYHEYALNSGSAFSGSGITSVGGAADNGTILIGEFTNCLGLTDITISNAKAIGAGAFSGCSNLMTVRFDGVLKDKVRNSIYGVYGSGYAGYGGSTWPFGLPSGCQVVCSDGTLTV